MVTVLREAGFRFVIYTDDHEPAHVHVIGDGELKVALGHGEALPELVRVIGMKAGDRRKAMDIVRANQSMLLARWQEIHGGEA
jgi:hypothetical protein